MAIGTRKLLYVLRASWAVMLVTAFTGSFYVLVADPVRLPVLVPFSATAVLSLGTIIALIFKIRNALDRKAQNPNSTTRDWVEYLESVIAASKLTGYGRNIALGVANALEAIASDYTFEPDERCVTMAVQFMVVYIATPYGWLIARSGLDLVIRHGITAHEVYIQEFVRRSERVSFAQDLVDEARAWLEGRAQARM